MCLRNPLFKYNRFVLVLNAPVHRLKALTADVCNLKELVLNFICVAMFFGRLLLKDLDTVQRGFFNLANFLYMLNLTLFWRLSLIGVRAESKRFCNTLRPRFLFDKTLLVNI